MRVSAFLLLLGGTLLNSNMLYAMQSKGDKSVVDASERVHIIWQSPEHYRDIKAVNGSNRRYQKTVFRHLKDKFSSLTDSLPHGHTLKLTVSDIDLAGEVFVNGLITAPTSLRVRNTGGFGLAGNSDIRLVDRNYIPRMEFTYQVLDADGNRVLDGEAQLKDFSFLDRPNNRRRLRPFAYEKAMIADWFSKSIAPHFS